MIEDLTGNIMRVVNGIADEATKRIMADHPSCEHSKVHTHIRQVLIDWFLGDFIPGDKR
jgi:hypothetical protein